LVAQTDATRCGWTWRRSRLAARLSGSPVCLRGVSTLTAFALTVELGDWNRFRRETVGPFLGLTQSENSSGAPRRQGGITKTGNMHARRLLIEAAWHQRSAPRLSITLERRRTGKS
jgi:transposase